LSKKIVDIEKIIAIFFKICNYIRR